MKKLILAAIFLVTGFQMATAQDESLDQVFKEMQKMQEELMKQFGQMDLNNQSFPFLIDTTLIHSFGDMDIDLNGPLFEQLNPNMLEGLFGQMQEELSKMDEEDWKELEQLFKNFEGFMPLSPQYLNPDSSTDPNEEPVKKDKKKRKIYKM